MQQLAKFILTILLASPLATSAQTWVKPFSKADSLFVFNPTVSEAKKKRMADSAFATFSTAPNFVVIIATNQTTGKTKEICTEAPFVLVGLSRNKSDKTVLAINRTQIDRHYYFNSKSALENIGFNEYSYYDLLLYGQDITIRNLVNQILKNNEVQSYNFQGTRKEQFMFAHILFNNGILSTRGCIAGNIMTLAKFE